MRALVWFRTDLRARDNTALAAAAKHASRGVVGLFVISPEEWARHDDAPCKVGFWLRALTDLSATLEKRNIALAIETARNAADVPAVVERAAQRLDCNALFFNRQYEVDEQARDAAAAERFTASGRETWITELIWREFYRHILVGFPRVSRHQPFRLETRRLEWSGNEEHFDAWKEGRTGVPIVDAAMRCLRATGWMHNRLRMITAMHLTKDLFLDWRRGERWFMRNLIDGDLASNNGGWQWSASTGTDAAPYFRIFNPVSQSRKFDPDGAFIRAWVPELRDLAGGEIHDPSSLPELARARIDYPAPIVNHTQARERAIAAFKALG